jgi:hypothetical protein
MMTTNQVAMDFEDWFAQEISPAVPAAAAATGGKTNNLKQGNSGSRSGKSSNGPQQNHDEALLARKRAQNRRDNREYRRRKKAKVEALKHSVKLYKRVNENLKKENEELEKMLAIAKQKVSQRCGGESIMMASSVESVTPFHSPGPNITPEQEVVPPARVTPSHASFQLPIHFIQQHKNTRQGVRFAETAHLCLYEQDLEDNKEKDNKDHHEFWYTESECFAMRRAAIQDAVRVLSNALAGAPFDYSGKDDASVCCVGIENLLAPSSCSLKVSECVGRCISAVLTEQAKQGSSEMDIALASIAQTRKVALRARKLGIFHQDSI